MSIHTTGRQWIYYGITLLSVVAYASLSFLAPQNPSSNSFGLTQTQIFFLKITIIVPYALTWALAANGIATLEKYIIMAKEKSDVITPLLTSFRTGLIWIVLGTVITALINGFMPFYTTQASLLRIFTITVNYLYVFPALIGFFVIYRGVLQLQESSAMQNRRHTSYITNTVIVLIISVIYIFLIYTNPTRQFSSNPAIPPSYYLPDVMIACTIVLPIITTWWFGFYASFTLSNLIPYLTRVEFFKGTTRILYGVWSIIFTSIVIQALLSLGGTRLYAIGLGTLLLIIYGFVFLQGLGYLFIALGSNALQKSIKENTNV